MLESLHLVAPSGFNLIGTLACLYHAAHIAIAHQQIKERCEKLIPYSHSAIGIYDIFKVYSRSYYFFFI